MGTEPHRPPGLASLLTRLASTGSGAVRNRVELFSVEWQQERARLCAVLVNASALVVAGCTAALLLCGLIVFALPASLRLLAVAILCLLWAGGAFLAWRSLRDLLRRASFTETLEQLKKDRLWLDSSKTRN